MKKLLGRVLSGAAAAGAAALAVWDVAGPASFPAVPDDGALPLPVIGMGSQQGQGLARLAADQPGLTVALRAGAPAEAPRVIASFSSWGPTTDGRQKPDLVAPATQPLGSRTSTGPQLGIVRGSRGEGGGGLVSALRPAEQTTTASTATATTTAPAPAPTGAR